MKASLLLFLALSCASCFASTNCFSTYNAGTSNAPVTFCITENGNIASIVAGDVMLNGAEGYAICPFNGESFYDLGAYGDSGNWQASAITQPKGPNTFPLTISRTSTSGFVNIVQVFSFSSAKKGVKVTMTVTGVSGGALIRYADVSGDGRERGDVALRSAFVVSQFGLMAAPAPNQFVRAKLLFGGPGQDPCNPTQPAQLPYMGDSALEIVWVLSGGKKSPNGFEYLPIW